MEVDGPSEGCSTTTPSACVGQMSYNILKRCVSVPNIDSLAGESVVEGVGAEDAKSVNISDTSSGVSSSNTKAMTPPDGLTVQIVDRTRRFSTSSVGGIYGLHSPTAFASGKYPSRLDQIKLEEAVKQSDRETAHEKETQSTMMISHNWDELSLDDAEAVSTSATSEMRRPKSFGEPLHVFTSNYPYASSPSPTRVGKQCYSPSLQQAVRNYTLTPSPSPSPTRKSFVRRSISPIVFRPSPLSAVKRKIEIENSDGLGEAGQSMYSATPHKKLRASSFSCSSTTAPTLDANPTVSPNLYQPLILSVSGSSSGLCSVGGGRARGSNAEETSCDDRSSFDTAAVSMDECSSSSNYEEPATLFRTGRNSVDRFSSPSSSGPPSLTGASPFTFRPVHTLGHDPSPHSHATVTETESLTDVDVQEVHDNECSESMRMT